MTEDGYMSNFDEGHKNLVHAYSDLRESGKTVSARLVALALTDSGEAASYEPMELDDPLEGEEERRIYDGAIPRYARKTGGKSAIQANATTGSGEL